MPVPALAPALPSCPIHSRVGPHATHSLSLSPDGQPHRRLRHRRGTCMEQHTALQPWSCSCSTGWQGRCRWRRRPRAQPGTLRIGTRGQQQLSAGGLCCKQAVWHKAKAAPGRQAACSACPSHAVAQKVSIVAPLTAGSAISRAGERGRALCASSCVRLAAGVGGNAGAAALGGLVGRAGGEGDLLAEWATLLALHCASAAHFPTLTFRAQVWGLVARKTGSALQHQPSPPHC